MSDDKICPEVQAVLDALRGAMDLNKVIEEKPVEFIDWQKKEGVKNESINQ